MNYNLVKREVEALAQDLAELGAGLLRDVPEGTPKNLPRAVKTIPDTLDELRYILEKLNSLVEYIEASRGGKDHA